MSDDDDEEDDLVYFLYEGQERDDIPRDVIHVRVHSSVKKIGRRAFSECRQLTAVILNDNLEEIGENAFEMCTSLEEIVIPDAVKVIKEMAFACCEGLTSITLGDGLEEIGEQAFCWCESVESIIIPPAVKMIQKWTFLRCSKLTSVILNEGLEEIGEEAFCYCILLKRIIIPATVKAINANAFKGYFPTSVEFCEEIEEFVSCKAMRDWWGTAGYQEENEEEEFVSYVVMPDWWDLGPLAKSLITYGFLVQCNIPERVGLVQVMEWQADIYEMLSRIPAMKPDGMNPLFVTIESKLTSYENLKDGNDDIRDVRENYVYKGRWGIIPDDVINVSVHSSVRAIHREAFANHRQLVTAILNDGLEEIGRRAFHRCTSLQRIVIPNAIKSIEDSTFSHCHGLTTVQLGNGLEVIGREAFANTPLEEIVIPNAVRAIKMRAFHSSNLTTVTFGNGLEEIGEEAFHSTSLERIDIPYAIKVIADRAFNSCRRLTTVNLNDGLEEIGGGAFGLCVLLECIAIPPTVKVIKEFAFSHCKSLRRLVIPPAVKVIQNFTFMGCSGMTTVILNEGLEEIGIQAFSRCTSLQRIVIPTTVKVINDRAFRKCSNLTSVVFCEEIEEFVSCEAMRDWWNQGVHKKSLSTYCFLVQSNIPERLGLVRVRSWQANIYKMLRRIPNIHPESVNSFFVSIESKLTFYENLKDTPALLELAIWKSKIDELCGQRNSITTKMMMQCRSNSVAMVTIIVPNVMSYLTDGDDSDCVIDCWVDEDSVDEFDEFFGSDGEGDY